MEVYTYSEARQHLSRVLDRAKKSGMVRIRRRGGMVFQVTPVGQKSSPFDVGCVDASLTRNDILAAVRESRAFPRQKKRTNRKTSGRLVARKDGELPRRS